MKTVKIGLIGGLLILLTIASFASNGNPRIPAGWPGASSAAVFCNTQPYQDDNQTAGSLYLLSIPANYFVDTTAYPSYVKYGVASTPVTTNNGYLLLKDGTSRYAVAGFTLGSPVGPSDQLISSVAWYNMGIPDAPTNIVVDKGFETARVAWELSPNYQYSYVDLTIKKKSDGSIIPATGGVQTTILGGGARTYNIGEYVDGRKLESGVTYTIELVGRVRRTAAGTYYSSSLAAADFTMKAGGGSQSAVIDLVRGMNTFSIGMPSGEVGGGGLGWAVKKSTDLNPTIVRTIGELIGVIGDGTVVSTFGYVNPGISGAVNGVRSNGAVFTANPEFTNQTISKTQGYQVYLKQTIPPITFPITLIVSNEVQ